MTNGWRRVEFWLGLALMVPVWWLLDMDRPAIFGGALGWWVTQVWWMDWINQDLDKRQALGKSEK